MLAVCSCANWPRIAAEINVVFDLGIEWRSGGIGG